MIKKLFIAAIVVFLSSQALAAERDKPKTRHVEITSGITEVVIDIYPTLGVKCIFPWVLTQNNKELPFKMRLINGNVFEMNRPEGQNYVLFSIKQTGGNIEGALSDAFINVAGYHFVFRLRATFNDRRHYSSVVFDLGKAEKLDLIERSIQRRMTSMRKEFALKEKELDKRANLLALKLVGRMSLAKPKRHRIKTDNELKLTNGDKVVFYCDQIYDYGSILVIPIEIKNKSSVQPLYVQNIALEKENPSGSSVPIISEFEISDVKLGHNAVTTGFVVTEDVKLAEKGDTKCTLFTDRGSVEVAW